MTIASCVDGENYPIEYEMIQLSRLKDVHVVCIFDCCRNEELHRIPRPSKDRFIQQTPRYTMTYACEEGDF